MPVPKDFVQPPLTDSGRDPVRRARSSTFLGLDGRASWLGRLAVRAVVGVQRMLLKGNVVLTRDLNLIGRPRDLSLDTGSDSFDYVRVSSLELLAWEINSRGVRGSVAEVGVFRGYFAQKINYLFPGRRLYLFDTFDGFPEKDKMRDSDGGLIHCDQNFSDTTVETVLASMPDRSCCIPKVGVFPDTAAGVEDTFAFVSLDADLFEPTYHGLKFFYPRLEKGGAIFVHDYNNVLYGGAREAVDRFIAEDAPIFVPLSDHYGTMVFVR